MQTHDESYRLADISSVEPARTLGVMPNAIRVFLSDGRRERFVVMNRGAWLERLRATIHGAAQ